MINVEEMLVAWLARKLGRPVRWTETRSESMVALVHGRAQRLDFTIGGTRDGKVLAYRLDSLQDSGAYAGARSVPAEPDGADGERRLRDPADRVRGLARSSTNTTPIAAFRGAGRPEAAQAIERAMDMFAAELGIDPVEVRRRNFIPTDAFPYTTVSHAAYDSGDYEGALDLALRSAGYDELRAEQQRRRELGVAMQLGIGISCYVEITNGDRRDRVRRGRDHGGRRRDPPHRLVLARPGARDDVRDDRRRAARAADREGDASSKGDTDEIAKGTGTYGSKSTQIGGAAARLAAEDVLERAKQLVADYLEASPADIVLDPGRRPPARGRATRRWRSRGPSSPRARRRTGGSAS